MAKSSAKKTGNPPKKTSKTPAPAKKAASKPPAKPSRPAVVVKAAKPVKPAVAPPLPQKPVKGAKAPAKIHTKTPKHEAPAPVLPKKSLLTKPELEHFRELLWAKRRELVGDMSSMEREALQRGGSSNLSNLPIHMADMGTDNYEQEFTLGLMEKDRNLLREINHALSKIQDNTFGFCEATGKAITKARLEVQPWARYSIEHARKMEGNFFRR